MTQFPVWPAGGADALERAMLETWKSEDLFRTAQAAGAEGPPFVFFEGPPTANGRPGIHHVFARTIKDLICRYQALQGKRVTRIAGWDTHGLPVEIEVEKELRLTGKKDIEQFGVAEFNRRAKASVFKYQGEWEQLSDRIGYWLDYERPYVTYTNDYIESVWWLLKALREKDLLYRGHRVLPYCPRCGTVLSSHELALGYAEVADKSIYVTFPLADGSGRELVVWTTTPWTLPSNVAVAVSAELEYVTLGVASGRFAGRKLVVARSRVAALANMLKLAVPGPDRTEPPGSASTDTADVLSVELGSTLAGLRYERPLEVVAVPADAAARLVIAADFVTADEGSGMVHLAPAFGADDFKAGQEHGLAFLRPVAGDGTFTGTTWPELEGRLVTADETNELIIRRLKADGRHLHTEQYVHSYPHCWRCKSKLIYYARDSWFVRTSAVKDRMRELNAQINWTPPEVGSGRFGEWLENNVDWALSRDRYWGTPLPVWVNDRNPDDVVVIGSYAELAERAGRPIPADFDPHKPYIDEWTWPAADGGTYRRVSEVIDTWFDSGAMPYAQWHWPFENEDAFRSHFPADYICEGLDQTRGWFYSLLAIGTTVFDTAPYRNVIVNGLVLDAQGQKMSKSRGNTVDPWQLVGEHGADVVRLYLLASGQVWLPKKFDPRAIPETAGGFLNTLEQTYRFFQLYAGDWTPGEERPAAERPRADRWILSRLATTIAAMRAAFDAYDVTSGVRALMEFVDADLSKWYVRLNRARFWAPNRAADPDAVATLHEVLTATARLLAPAAPFASDWLHRALTGGSVHLARFPDAGPTDPALEAAMSAVRTLASLARAAREAGNLKVRQPVRAVRVAVPATVRGADFDALLALLADEVNARRIEPVDSEESLVALRAKANFRTLGKRFGKRTPEVAAALGELGAASLRVLEAGAPAPMPFDGGMVEILPEDVVVERVVTTDWLVAADGPYVAAVDPSLDDELRAEGIARELTSRLQRMRKDAGYAVGDRIHVWLDGDAAVLAAAAAHRTAIAEETLALSLETGARAPVSDLEQSHDLDGRAAVLGIRRASVAESTT